MAIPDLSTIQLTPLLRIPVESGDVLRVLRKSDTSFTTFGECYISLIEPECIKGWKRHTSMTMNLTVPVGEVKFVFHIPGQGFRVEEIGQSNYSRLTVPPGIWFAFRGSDSSTSVIINIANIEHEPAESQKASLESFQYEWS